MTACVTIARRHGSLALCLLTIAGASSRSRSALAYRPFDGTDADVAHVGTVELELGPVGYVHQLAHDAAVLPALVLNQGIDDDVELVLQTNRLWLLGPLEPREPRVQYVDTGFFVKGVWREGALQGASGPSIAIELGPLLPTGPNDHAVGAIATTILSARTPAATLHFNFAPSLTVGHDFDLFASAIVEGPHTWPIRPVAETYVSRDFAAATTYSWLLGVIVSAHQGLELDAGARLASVDGSPVFEGRLGLTWTLQIWSKGGPAIEGGRHAER
jgi:hypothetical protein